MRVGFDVSPLTAKRTGVGNYSFALLKHLLRQGGDCTFHGFSSGLRPIVLEDLPGLAGHRHLPLPTRALYTLWAAAGRPRVDQLLGGVDVFHATNYYLGPTADARRVVSFYDLAFLRVPELCSPKIVGPFARNVPRFAAEADAIITCSEATKQDVISLLDVPAEKVAVAYGAVDEALAPMPRAEAEALLKRHYGLRPPYVLFVSTLEPRKNVQGLVRAFASACRGLPHRLVLVGGMGWGAEGIERAIANCGMADRIDRLGYVSPPSHLPAFYAAAEALFFPSFYEGFGLPVAEAMTCGCPVVTSDRSSLPEVGGEAARYANPDDTGDMSAVLSNVLENEALREEMRQQGYAQARRFSWDDCARATLDVYRRVVACA